MKQINRNAACMACACALSMTPCAAVPPVAAPVASAVADQVQTVSGTVTDGTEPVIGATVRVKGTKDQATVTDFDGHFTLRVSPGTLLEISYVGFKPQTVKAPQYQLRLEHPGPCHMSALLPGKN